MALANFGRRPKLVTPSSRPCYPPQSLSTAKRCPSPPLFTVKLPPPPPFAKLPSTAFLQARLPITISPRRRRVGGELRLAVEINGGGEVMEGSLAEVRGRRWRGACRGEVLEGAWRREAVEAADRRELWRRRREQMEG